MYLFYTGNVKLPGDYDYIDAGRISTQLLVESEDGQHMSEKIKLLGVEDYPKSMTQHIRDPKVWKEDGGYYMILGARERAWDDAGNRRDKGAALIYVSEDKRSWRLHQELTTENAFGYMWECPDLFRLGSERILSYCPQGLETQEEKFQNIYQSGYSVLSRNADPEKTFREWDMGFDFYAPQSFEADDGRRILIGWAGMPDTAETHRNLSVANGWQHCLTIPCELEYREEKVFRMPVRELYDLDWKEAAAENGRYHWEGKTVKLTVREIGGDKTEIRIGSSENGMTISSEENLVVISFSDMSGNPSQCGGGRRRRAGRTEEQVEELLIIIDSSIVEIFVNSGETVFTTRLYLENAERDINVYECKSYTMEVV